MPPGTRNFDFDLATDTYYTLAGDSEGSFRDLGSKFLSYAYHVESEEEIRERLDELRKKYYDATHHCYAWRLGAQGEPWRAGDDGEPAGSAGRPILGQLLSQGLTYVLVVVVRYFGGTKLGVPGLIQAYREATADAIANGQTVERTEDAYYEVTFPYLAMNDVMKAIKEYAPTLSDQVFDNLCRITLSIRRDSEAPFVGKLSKIEGADVKFLYHR